MTLSSPVRHQPVSILRSSKDHASRDVATGTVSCVEEPEKIIHKIYAQGKSRFNVYRWQRRAIGIGHVFHFLVASRNKESYVE